MGAAELAALAAQAPPGATPPGPAVDPTPRFPGGPISAAGVVWQNGRTTEEMRRAWAAGARGAAAQRCPDCTAPLTWNRPIGGKLECWGCAHSDLPLPWRRKVTELWLTGIKASDIAQKMRCTKCAVLGYRRRARLPTRGSPLYGGLLPDGERAARQRRATAAAHRLAKLATPKPAKPPPQNRAFFVRPKRTKRAGGLKDGVTPVTGGAVRAVENVSRPKGTGELPRYAPRVGFTSCQYIIGRATFCDDATAERSPYCKEHTRLCFVGKAA